LPANEKSTSSSPNLPTKQDLANKRYSPIFDIHTDSLLLCDRIEAGSYYEAHQQLRVIAARYIKQSNYDAAAELLAGGATALLRAGSQQGASASGGDLAIMLVVDVYNKAEWEIQGGDNDTEGRARKSEFELSSVIWVIWVELKLI
jgi:hypothetical protein